MVGAVSGPFTLHALVEAAAAATPDAPAVRMKGEVLSYGALHARATAIAAHLAEAGVSPGDRVGLYQPKSLEGVAAIVGILGAGAAYVPVDPAAPPDRLRTILEHCGISVLFAAGRPLAQLEKLDPPLADTLIIGPGAKAGGETLLRGTDQDLAYVLYTSGSTGRPKGVAITHGQSLSFVRTATETFELTPADVLVSHAPFNFDLSVIDLWCTFAAGASVVLLPEAWLAFPTKIAAAVEEQRISVWNSVPTALIQLVSKGGLDKRDLSSLRLIMFAGEPFPIKHLSRLADLVPDATLLNVYGQTEANSSTYFVVDQVPDEPSVLPIGRPFPNYEVLVLDDDGAQIEEPDREGELYVIGGAVAAGYWNEPERTAAAFVQHPLIEERRLTVYRTGDRVAYDARGDLLFRGRVDAAVKCRGYRVELGEVEAVASQVAGVAQVCVVPVPHEELTNILVMFVVAEIDTPFDEPALRAHLGALLPRYMLPEAIVTKAALPSTGTGKVDRRALAAEALEAAPNT